ncbi:hypothetical protein [Asticcacaulis solisilvae]|uniref:hypothetical protein n=1 Tax=Asticcacaulis solisilvae TaxID=1217274 RepID=UPI003FD6CD4B
METRALTPAERAALPQGLVAALPDGIVLVNAHHPLSHLSRIFRGFAVILVRHKTIYWPGLIGDMSSDPAHLSLLAHELMHVLQYQAGMTVWRYVLRDVIGNLGGYTYKLETGKPFDAYAYEQQAAMVEDWVLLSNGLPQRYGAFGTTRKALAEFVPVLNL